MSQSLTRAVGRNNGYETDMKQAYGEIFANLASIKTDGDNEQRSGVKRQHKRLAKRRGFVTNPAPEFSKADTLTKVHEQDFPQNGNELRLQQNLRGNGTNYWNDKRNGFDHGKKLSHQKLRRLSENRTEITPKSEISLSGLRHSESDSKLSFEGSDFSNISDLSISSSSGSDSCFESEVKTALNVIRSNIGHNSHRQKSRIEKADVIYDDNMREKIAHLLRTCDTSVEGVPHYKTIRTKHDTLYVIKADV